MSKQVLFSSEERVDLPDMQVVLTYCTDELRRHIRHVIAGEGVARVLRGFLVEPEVSGVSPRIKVRMSFGGAELGTFVGALSLPNGFDFGQLQGGHDANGPLSLDGAAQNLLDFTGQAPGLYDVKCRATFVPGSVDNRAFWNPSLNTEFVAATPTRLLPEWELAFAGHSDPDWVLLGTVNWNGANVSTADIVDKRTLPLEGQGRDDTTAALRWSLAEQGDAGVVGDFDRNVDRSGDAGISALWSGFRALARQVQDLKGGRDTDLRFDWFSRPYHAPGPWTGSLAARTKSLRTVDTVTFTVGDDTTEQGDFRGSLDSLYECFAFISANSAALPRRIKILVKNRYAVGLVGQPLYTWPAPVNITGHVITVEAIGNSLQSASTAATTLPPGLIELDPAAISGANTMLTISAGGLFLENLAIHPTTGSSSTTLDVAPDSTFGAKNCAWGGQGIALRCGHEGLDLEHCAIEGISYIGGRGVVPLGHAQSRGGSVRDCALFGLVRLRYQDLSGANTNEKFWLAQNVGFERCVFNAGLTAVTPSALGQVDLTGAKRITIRDCEFWYQGDQDCIRIGSVLVNAVNIFVQSEHIRIVDNDFHLNFSAAHGSLTGVNLTEGTGWAVKIAATANFAAVVHVDQIPRHIKIADNSFDLIADGLGGLPTSSCDAGAIYAIDSKTTWIDDNEITKWTEPAAGPAGLQVLIAATASATGATFGGGSALWVRGNFIGQFAAVAAGAPAWGSGALTCMVIENVSQARISDNVVSALNTSGTLIDPNPNPAALVLANCAGVDVYDNRFLFWRSNTDPLNSTCIGLRDIILDCTFEHNTLIACGGYNITVLNAAAILSLTLSDNKFHVGLDDSKFHGAVLLLGAASVIDFHGHNNSWDYNNSGALRAAIALGPNAVQFSVFGNYFKGGVISQPVLAGTPSADSFGYGLLAGQAVPNNSFNFVSGYS